jgi:hypothetical protein
VLVDTVRGSPNVIQSNTSNAQASWTNEFGSFSSTGFTVPYNTIYGETNFQTRTYTSWTFRKQPKFFDVLTYTGDGVLGREIPHNLGSVPGSMIIKRTDSTGSWAFYHRSLASNQALILDGTNASFTATYFNSTAPTSTVFTVGAGDTVNGDGFTYVAYLFAHDAGGFGLTGTDNVISCGSYTGNGTIQTVSLGYEPQWVLVKNASSGARGYGSSWAIQDNMRGFPSGGAAQTLYPDRSEAEDTNTVNPNATGFSVSSYNVNGDNYIYIAIRRGPMKVPTVGTSVFAPALNTNSASGSSGSPNYLTNFPVDLAIRDYRPGGVGIASPSWQTRLTGTNYLVSSVTDSEYTSGWYFDSQTGFYYPTAGSNSDQNGWFFRRAPSYMDVVCYTGTSANRTVTHNLGVVPEMMIIKNRTSGLGESWNVYHSTLGNTSRVFLEQNSAVQTGVTAVWNSTTPTASVFSLGTNNQVNLSGSGIVAYLFATCAGVSKVGSYTGNGTTQTINCGFTGGARFVLIKKTSGTGDWMVSDSARGIVSGNDPYLELNNTNAEVTGEDWLDTNSTGFVVNEVSGSNANTSSATYIFLAIA